MLPYQRKPNSFGFKKRTTLVPLRTHKVIQVVDWLLGIGEENKGSARCLSWTCVRPGCTGSGSILASAERTGRIPIAPGTPGPISRLWRWPFGYFATPHHPKIPENQRK